MGVERLDGGLRRLETQQKVRVREPAEIRADDWSGGMRRCGAASELGGLLVGVAPHPTLARLNPTHEGMAHVQVVPGGVGVLRRITAADLAALQTHPQMHPAVAQGHALFALLGGGFGQCVDLGQVSAPR